MSNDKSPILQSNARVVSFSTLLQNASESNVIKAKSHRLPRSEQEIQNAIAEGRVEGFKLGQEEGYAQGRIDGIEETKRELEDAKNAALQAFVQDLNQLRESFGQGIVAWFAQAEIQMTPVIMEIASEVLRTELKTSRDSIVEIVKDAMREITHSTTARVRINPFDSELLREKKAEMLLCGNSLKEIEFVDDPSIEGGCMIETEGGLIDATFRNKLKMLESEAGEAA